MSVARNIARVLEGILDSLRDDANAAAARTTLGVGAGDTPTFTGVTASGAGTIQDANGVMIPGPVVTASQATTSGTAVALTTSIPPWATRVDIALSEVQTNGTDDLMIQMGDSGGLETSGYVGTTSYGTAYESWSGGILLTNGGTSATIGKGGVVSLVLLDASTNTWAITVVMGNSSGSAAAYFGGGSKSLSAALDRVSITTQSGSDTFDAGVASVRYS